MVCVCSPCVYKAIFSRILRFSSLFVFIQGPGGVHPARLGRGWNSGFGNTSCCTFRVSCMTLIWETIECNSGSVKYGRVSCSAFIIFGRVHPTVYGFSSSSGCLLNIFFLYDHSILSLLLSLIFASSPSS